MLQVAQHKVLGFRERVEADFPTPSPRDSAAFVAIEAGELQDAVLKAGYSDARYLRNDPDGADVEGELGDLLFMALTLANQLGINADRALRRTLAKIERRIQVDKSLG